MQASSIVPLVRRIVTDRRIAALAVSVVVFVYSFVELVSLAFEPGNIRLGYAQFCRNICLPEVTLLAKLRKLG